MGWFHDPYENVRIKWKRENENGNKSRRYP